jgi:hypothetical protein
MDMMTIDDWIVFSTEFYESTIEPARLGSLGANKLPLVDDPTDGLPSGFREFVRALKERGVRK